MCYDTAAPISYEEYVCPLDGEKSIYSQTSAPGRLTDNIIPMRRLTEQLNKISKTEQFSLDEKRLCGKCSPDLTPQERDISLVVKHKDGKTTTTKVVSLTDLRMLKSFLEKKVTYANDLGIELPLKDKMLRINALLGKSGKTPKGK